MLVSILLHLRAESDAILPPSLGRANHAATLARLQLHAASLSAAAHDGDGPKPLTCSPLLGAERSRSGVQQVHTGIAYQARITGLTPAVSEGLLATLVAQPPTHWRLDSVTFAVDGASCDADAGGWQGRSSYEALAARHLGGGAAPSPTAELLFATPVAFRSKGLTVPLPLPSLVFGSLVERWNAFSPITVSPEMRRYGEEMIALSRYRLESAAVEGKQAGLRIGGTGRATYRAVNNDRYWVGVMQMLADFALYSGVGVQTATGMGQCRKLERAPEEVERR